MKMMEVILPAMPAPSHQAAIEVKTCSALGQATRGNSELKEIEFLQKAWKQYIWKSGTVELALLLFKKESCQTETIFLAVSLVTFWCAVPGVQAAARQGQQQ